jgi:O-antigen ligase
MVPSPAALAAAPAHLHRLLREVAGGGSELDFVGTLNDVRPVLFVVLWAPLFVHEQHRRGVVAAYAIGLLVYTGIAVLTVLATGKAFYPGHVGATSLGLPGLLETGYIALLRRTPELGGPFLVVGLFAALQLAWDGVPRRWFWALLAVLAAGTLLFSSGRRTGQVAFVACAALFVVLNMRRIDWKAGIALAGVLVASALLIAASPTASKGVARVVADAKEFMATPAHQRGHLWSSGGERLHYWDVAVRIAAESPWVGASFARYGDRFRAIDARMGGTHKPQTNPHNEYLLVLGATGAIGLLLYAAIYAATLRRALALRSGTQRKIVLLFLLAVLTGILFNSMLIDMIPGHFFAIALLTLGCFEWRDADPPSAAGVAA